MLKKVITTMELGSPSIVVRSERGKAVVEETLTLESFEIRNNRIEWIVRDSKGRIIEGRVKDKREIPAFADAWMTLSIPLTIHVFENLCPSFIFCLPNSRRILSRGRFEQEFPGQSYQK